MSAQRVIDVKINGIQEVQKTIHAFGAEVVAEVRKALNATGLEMLTDVREAIKNGPKTGTIYYRIPGKNYMTIRAGSADGPPVAFIPGGGKRNLSLTHQASAPDQPPASDTGILAGSIYYKLIGNYSVAVGSRLPYSAHLEFGTMKIKKRPAWLPAAERAAPRLEKRLARIIAQARATAEKTTK